MNKTINFAEGLLNPHQEKLEELKKLLPNLFDKDGNLIKSELENFTQNYTQEKQEPFVFSWAGKQKAKGMAFKQSETKLALKFDEKRSKNFDKTENLIIEGDNLHVLKLLLSSYKGKVKCIYIDPPYNTQNDFIYPDNFAESEKEYLLNSGQIDLDGEVIINDRIETAGRKHSVWLSMIYPRLVLARELLREDGVIFVSIDDNEIHHLRQLMNEVFGEENLIANIVWETRFNPISLTDNVSDIHEYVVMFSKNRTSFKPVLLPRTEKQDSRYKNPDNDPRGDWSSDNLTCGPAVQSKLYEIITPSGRIVKPSEGLSWIFTKERMNEMVKENRIWFGENGDNMPRLKRFLSEVKQGITPTSLWKFDDIGGTQDGVRCIKDLFDGSKLFDFPKPVSLIKRILQISTNSKDLILDFFAGSGTTGQAVMELNQEEIDKKAKDGFLTNEEKEVGGRKFILVQLPEKIDPKKEAFKAGYKKISDITVERVRRAGEKYQSVDAGFKVMSVTESALNRKFMNSIQATEQEIFAEIALSYGYGLNFEINKLLDGVWKLAADGRSAVIILGSDQLSNEVQKQIILLSDKLKDCRIFAQDACLNVEIIHNLYQHFEQKKVVVL